MNINERNCFSKRSLAHIEVTTDRELEALFGYPYSWLATQRDCIVSNSHDLIADDLSGVWENQRVLQSRQ